MRVTSLLQLDFHRVDAMGNLFAASLLLVALCLLFTIGDPLFAFA